MREKTGTEIINKQERLALLDAIRGFVLVNMIAYHLLYDLVALFGVRLDWYWAWPGRLWQQMIVGSFIFISGFSSQLSHKNGRRGWLLLGCGMLLSLVTWAVMPDQLIRFGVLHFLGIAALLWAFAGRWINRIPAGVLFCSGLFFFLMTRGTQNGSCVFGLLQLPTGLYQSRWLFPLGFPGPGFHSSDYVPLLPWIFLYLAGTAAERMVRRSPAALQLLTPKIPFLSFWGSRTLIVYLVHQPILYGICLLLMR